MMVSPPLGNPPSLEWLPLDRLSIDESYQRSLDNEKSKALVRRIATGWDWRLFQPLAVARRTDGGLYVIDGQHRLAGARMRGDIPHLPAVVSSFDDAPGEARAFAAMNRERKSMSRLEHYRAAAVGGDAATLEAVAAITAAGLTLAPNENYTTWKPKMIACIGGVVRGLKQHGRKPVEAALCALAEAYPDDVMQYAGTLFSGLLAIYSDAPADFDPDALIDAMQDQMQEDWLDRARVVAKANLWTMPVAVRFVLLAAAKSHRAAVA